MVWSNTKWSCSSWFCFTGGYTTHQTHITGQSVASDVMQAILRDTKSGTGHKLKAFSFYSALSHPSTFSPALKLAKFFRLGLGLHENSPNMTWASRFPFGFYHRVQTNLSKTHTTAAHSELAHPRTWNRSQGNTAGKQLCWESLCVLDICPKMKRCFNWSVTGGENTGKLSPMYQTSICKDTFSMSRFS